MIRVLHLLPSSGIGGGPRHVADLVTYLPPSIACWTWGDLNRASGRMLAQVVRMVRAYRIDVLHGHGAGGRLYAAVAGMLTRRPSVLTYHGLEPERFGPVARRAVLAAERAWNRMAAAAIHVSESQATYGRMLGLPGRVIPNGIDAALVRAKADAGPNRLAVGLPLLPPVIGSVGRWTDPVKGLGDLLDAYGRLRDLASPLVSWSPKVVSSAWLCLVGPVPAMDAWPRRVFLTGEVPEAVALFGCFDLYASASRSEGMPYGVMEAMACGLPVVATAVRGHVDLVEDGVTGRLVEREGLASAMAELLADPDRREAMGEAGRERIAAYPVEAMVAATSEVYEEVAG